MRAAHPGEPLSDLRGGLLLPGFVDTHVHYPQVRLIGGLGLALLDWLDRLTLPEEAKFSDAAYAAAVAREFVAGLVGNGTTSALVFGSHFAGAVDTLFQEASRVGLRGDGGAGGLGPAAAARAAHHAGARLRGGQGAHREVARARKQPLRRHAAFPACRPPRGCWRAAPR